MRGRGFIVDVVHSPAVVSPRSLFFRMNMAMMSDAAIPVTMVRATPIKIRG
jgi:hypothetical protein